MSIKVIDKNHDTVGHKVYNSCHLAAKFLENYPDSEKGAVYLITTEKVITNSLLSKFDTLIDKFESFNLNLAVFETSESFQFVPDGPCFIIGGEKEYSKFSSVLGKNGIHISKKAHPEYKTLGYQRHLSIDPKLDSMGLGEVKADMPTAESFIRNAQSVFIDLNAMKIQDSYFETSSIIGFDFFEVAKMVRTAGLSQKNNLVFINTEDLNLNVNTEEVVSILFWYFMEGVQNRRIEDLESPEHKVYLVDSPFYSEPVKFVKGKITKRWWFIHPNNGESVACTKKDYETFKSGNIPDVFMNVID